MTFVIVIPLANVSVPLAPVTVKPEAEAAPSIGVTNVGDVANTNAPDPVSSVTAEARLAELGVPRKVPMPVPKPDNPVDIGSPVRLVATPEAGVPSIGAIKVGPLLSTTNPVPVSSLIIPPNCAEVVAPNIDKLLVTVPGKVNVLGMDITGVVVPVATLT